MRFFCRAFSLKMINNLRKWNSIGMRHEKSPLRKQKWIIGLLNALNVFGAIWESIYRKKWMWYSASRRKPPTRWRVARKLIF